jgi:RNA polymerase sigma-70 factor (ECF subfamily)
MGLEVSFAECEDYERVDERSEAGALAPLLRHAVRALPAEQRRALELRVMHGLPYDAVAGRLGCSTNAARLRVSRALRALTTQMRSARA